MVLLCVKVYTFTYICIFIAINNKLFVGDDTGAAAAHIQMNVNYLPVHS